MPGRQAVLDALPAMLQERLAAHFKRTEDCFAAAMAAGHMQALVLSGGYGRAEGGIASDASGHPCLFNDLDYFLFCSDPTDRQLLAQVRDWEAAESRQLGIDVEAVCIHLRQVDASGQSMMFYDFLHHHCVILGAEDFVRSRFRPPPDGCIAAIEVTRLLWNRGSGLLYARVDLDAMDANARAAVIHRNQAKVLLGLGDAWLALHGRYRPLVAQREQQMAQAPDVPARLRQWHAEGAAFKRRPTAPPELAAMRALQVELTPAWMALFFAVESQRMGQPIESATRYARLRRRLFPDSAVWRNYLLALRDRLRRGGHLSPVWDYPRAALQRALPLLLAEEPDLTAVRQLLGHACTDLARSCAIYRKWWEFYS